MFTIFRIIIKVCIKFEVHTLLHKTVAMGFWNYKVTIRLVYKKRFIKCLSIYAGCSTFDKTCIKT